MLEESEQNGTNGNIDPIDQESIDLNLNKIGSFNQTNGRGSLAWLGRQTHNLENNGANAHGPEVAGSNPAPGTTIICAV